MINMEVAISKLKEAGIEAFESDGILVVPCSSPEEIYDLAGKVRSIFKEYGYEKSWRIDPYYYERENTLTHHMFN